MVEGSSKWCVRAKTAMLKMGINQTQLAKEMEASRGYVSQVLNGYVKSKPMIEKISAYLGIPTEY